MLDASIVMLTSLATPYLLTGQMLPRTGDVGYSGAPTAAQFMAQDGVRVSLGVVQNNQFAALCQVMERPELLDDPRFVDPVSRSAPENAAVLKRIMVEVMATRDSDFWERELSARGAPCGVVRDIGQACDRARDSDRRIIMPTVIPSAPADAPPPAYVNAGFVFEHSGPGSNAPPPRLSENYASILAELDYSPSEIAALLAAGVVGTPAAAPAQG